MICDFFNSVLFLSHLEPAVFVVMDIAQGSKNQLNSLPLHDMLPAEPPCRSQHGLSQSATGKYASTVVEAHWRRGDVAIFQVYHYLIVVYWQMFACPGGGQ